MAQEKRFENAVKDLLKSYGCWFLKYWGGGEFTKAGVPDILACVNGKFLGIEVKAPKGKPSELQLYNLRKIDESGGYGILLYPKDFNLFRAFIWNIMNDIEQPILYEELKGRWSGVQQDTLQHSPML